MKNGLSYNKDGEKVKQKSAGAAFLNNSKFAQFRNIQKSLKHLYLPL